MGGRGKPFPPNQQQAGGTRRRGEVSSFLNSDAGRFWNPGTLSSQRPSEACGGAVSPSRSAAGVEVSTWAVDPSFERVQVPPVSRHPFIGLTFVCGNESEVGMKPHRGYPTCGARKQASQSSLPPDTPTPPCQAEPQDGRSWSSQRKTPGVRCAGDTPQGADPKRVALETESLVVAGSGGSTLGGLGQGLPETRQAGLCDSCREGPGMPAWGGHGRHLGAGRPLGRRAGSGRSESVVALMADHQFICGIRSQTDNCNSGSK